MEITLIHNTDTSGKMNMAYRIARVVYASCGAKTLPLVEAFTSMIKNCADKSGKSISNIIGDKNIFPVLEATHPEHIRLSVPADNRALQMCVRTALSMLSGNLSDKCYGATMFHHADTLPQWATSRGYIADIDGILFYL